MQRLTGTAALLGLLGFGLLPACGPEPAPAPLAGGELRSRTEARLAAGHAELRKSIGHYGLVSEVSPEELRAFMTQIFPRREGPDIVMSGFGGIELHGGGVLEIVASLWRPEGRRAQLSDRYPFVTAKNPVPLQEIYDSLQRQIFLPVPGVDAEAIAGQLPDVPMLARTRMRHRANGPPETSELDAFSALTLMLRYEADLDRSWTNRLGQRLSTRTLLDAAWDHYLLPRNAEQEFGDHSHLHLVEILLAYNQRLPPGRAARTPTHSSGGYWRSNWCAAIPAKPNSAKYWATLRNPSACCSPSPRSIGLPPKRPRCGLGLPNSKRCSWPRSMKCHSSTSPTCGAGSSSSKPTRIACNSQPGAVSAARRGGKLAGW